MNIKNLRLQLGLSQRRLAELAGVNPVTICHAETGKKKTSDIVLAKLERFFESQGLKPGKNKK